MLISNVSALLGDELDYVQDVDICIGDGVFGKVGGQNMQRDDTNNHAHEESIDCRGLLVVPGFVNAHTHIADSVGKDAALDSTVDQRIHPVSGVKSKILKKTPPDILSEFIRASCVSMLQKGITTVVDFREGGPGGVDLLRESLRDIAVRMVVLGRVDVYQGPQEVMQDIAFPQGREKELAVLLAKCDGLGVSGANENSTAVLERYARTGGLRAIHCSETQQSISYSIKVTGKSETHRALCMNPHFLVHMTHASYDDLCAAAGRVRGIVVCPRANSALAGGIPDIELMRSAGCDTIAIGTDNVMINSPDMFREMDFLWKVTMGMHKTRISARQILKMATVNGGKILASNVGAISTGMSADCIFLDKHALDLEPMHDVHASIVHRASESAIRAVMIKGEIVHGNLS